MATIKDIAKLLVEKHKISMTVAEDFLQNMVEVINEGLLHDRIVKIKGFGTFKLQEVKDRVSVNVNTGEKVVIAAHDKITFTPDAVMRDLVNKPFAHFETVIIDGNEVPLIKQKEVQITDNSEIKNQLDEMSVEEITKSEESNDIEGKLNSEEKKSKLTEQESTEVPTEESESGPSSKKIIYIFAGVICAAMLCLICYYALKRTELPKDTGKIESANVQRIDTIKKTPVKIQPNSAQISQEDDLVKYNKDIRVKYGAYYITGTDTIITVLKGQTLKGISKAYFGPDMECYIEVYNETKEVKVGDKIRIPKLKIKKKKNN